MGFPAAFCPSALAPFGVFFLSISTLTGSRSLMLGGFLADSDLTGRRSLIGGFLADPDFDAMVRFVTLQIKTSYTLEAKGLSSTYS